MKNWVKKAVLASGGLRLTANSQGPSAAILMYHSVLPNPAEQADSLGGIAHSETEFRAQMQLLARDYRPLSLDEVVKSLQNGRELPKHSVVVTFDDGYSDNFEVAMPILNQCGVPATFYVTVDCVEKRMLPWPSRLRFAFRRTKQAEWTDSRSKHWDLREGSTREQAYLTACDDCCQLSGEALNEFVREVETELQCAVPRDLNSLMMTYEHVRALAKSSHIVGSHTMTHPNMAYVKEEEARRELEESKGRLESETRIPIQHFSYPCPALSPHWSERTLEQSRAAGYESAVTTISGVTRRGDDPLSLKRMRPTKTANGLRWNLERAFAGHVV